MTGHDQAVVDRDRHADVDPALGQQALVGPVGVEGRVALEGLGRRLDDERDEAERPIPSFAWYALLGALAERDEAGRRRPPSARTRAGAASARVICAAMPLRIWVIGTRTSSAPAGNVMPALVAAAGARGRCRAAARQPRAPHAAGAAGAVPVRAASTYGEDVLAGDPPAAAGAGDLRRLEAVLAEQPSDGGGHAGVRVGVGGQGAARRSRPPGAAGAGGGAARLAAAPLGARRSRRGRSTGCDGAAGSRRPDARSGPAGLVRAAAGAAGGLGAAREGLVLGLDDGDLGVVGDGVALLARGSP